MSGQLITGQTCPYCGEPIDVTAVHICKKQDEIPCTYERRTIESVVDLLIEIEHPIVPFSKDQGEMARWAVEHCQAKAKEARRLLAGEDQYEVEEESNG